MIYFTADTHFGSQRTLELSRRPFKNVEEMDEELIRLWNETVTENDTVYHIGDFGNYGVLKRLNGKVILLLGNYELKDIEEGKLTIEALKNEYGFAEVYENLRIEELNNIFATHCPNDCKKDEFNLFAHIHGRQLCKRYGLDVGTDGHHFRPISKDTILFYKTAIEQFYDENVFE